MKASSNVSVGEERGLEDPETEETHSEEEVRIIIEQAARQGILDPGEKDMLESVFELEERRAREVMVPRPDVVSLPAGMPLAELFSVTARGKHTRATQSTKTKRLIRFWEKYISGM